MTQNEESGQATPGGAEGAPAPPDLRGRVALVTGAARGQGAAHAGLLAEAGAAVVLCDVLDEEGEATAASLREDGAAARYLHLDVSSEPEWVEVVAAVERELGRLDVLVNNAGIVHVAFPEEETVAGFNRILSVNTIGTFLGIKHGAPALRRAGGGSIVNVATAMTGAPAHIAYAASKGAVRMMTKCAAVAFADDGIRVNTICPGWVVTEQSAEEVEKLRAAGVPLVVGPRTLVKAEGEPRGARPREISQAVLFLASDASSFVNGAEIMVDGGFTAW